MSGPSILVTSRAWRAAFAPELLNQPYLQHLHVDRFDSADVYRARPDSVERTDADGAEARYLERMRSAAREPLAATADGIREDAEEERSDHGGDAFDRFTARMRDEWRRPGEVSK